MGGRIRPVDGLFAPPQKQGRRDGHRRVCSHQYANEKHESKAVDARSAQEIHERDGHDRGSAGQNGAGQGLVDGVVDDVAVEMAVSPAVLADAVEHHDGVDHGITHDGQNAGDDGQIDAERLDFQEIMRASNRKCNGQTPWPRG